MNNNQKKKSFFLVEKFKKNNEKFDFFWILTFFLGVFLIISTYAWFSTSMDYKVKFFTIKTATDTGLFISLDGVDFTSTIDVNAQSVIENLKTYPNHKNHWASKRMYPLSTNGIPHSDKPTFDIFNGLVFDYKPGTDRRVISVKLYEELEPNLQSTFIAFDIFLKNKSNAPKPDNLYLDEGSGVELVSNDSNDNDGVINAMRIGFLKMDSVSLNSDVKTIQNAACNKKCESIIFEPRSTRHSVASIARGRKMGVLLSNGTYAPTYAIIKEGRSLESRGGHFGTKIPLDREHFQLQETLKDTNRKLFQIPNAITKLRVYVWVEGQDIDILESVSKGSNMKITLNFKKDLAGYE